MNLEKQLEANEQKLADANRELDSKSRELENIRSAFMIQKILIIEKECLGNMIYNGSISHVLLNYVFLYLKLEFLTQFPASNE